jgi:hypothetical protein
MELGGSKGEPPSELREIRLAVPTRGSAISISKLNVEHALQDEKKVIGVVMFVPDKFAFQFHDHDIEIVELGNCARRKVLGKRRQFLRQINAIAHGSLRHRHLRV